MHGTGYFPTKARISQEIIATVIGVVVAAIIISRVPALKKIVDGGSIWALTNPNTTTVTG